MSHVTLSHIKKSFGTVDVIHGVSIDIEEGEFVALVGPSGCGKSTLLRMIAGLEDPSAGEIEIGDQVVNDLLPKDRGIAMVFQSYALYPHMTVRENMSFSLTLEKRSQAEIDKAVNEASEILGLNALLDRKPKALSGGQRQRVAMGRAIVRKPKVFLFDEPLSNLDAKLRTVMRKEVKLLHQRLKTTSIYVTHDQTEAMTMADKIVVMNAGRIEQIGSPMDLYKIPGNLFVASFIGAPQMNLIEGVVRNATNVFEFHCGAYTLKLPKELNVSDEQKMVIGIRPEHLQLDPAGALTVTVDVVEPMGNEIHLSGTAHGHEIRCIVSEDLKVSPQSELAFNFDIAKAHFFDKATGAGITH